MNPYADKLRDSLEGFKDAAWDEDTLSAIYRTVEQEMASWPIEKPGPPSIYLVHDTLELHFSDRVMGFLEREYPADSVPHIVRSGGSS